MTIWWRDADYVYPKGAHPHLLYGRSSNQELVNVSKTTQIDVDDYVFLRPTQSEAIIPAIFSFIVIKIMFLKHGKLLESNCYHWGETYLEMTSIDFFKNS